jgi:hypothetical protein
MSTTLIEPDTPRLHIPPGSVIPDHGSGRALPSRRLDTPPEGVIPDLAFILGLVYLEAGLPPEAALRSGLADYECSYSGLEMETL